MIEPIAQLDIDDLDEMRKNNARNWAAGMNPKLFSRKELEEMYLDECVLMARIESKYGIPRGQEYHIRDSDGVVVKCDG